MPLYRRSHRPQCLPIAPHKLLLAVPIRPRRRPRPAAERLPQPVDDAHGQQVAFPFLAPDIGICQPLKLSFSKLGKLSWLKPPFGECKFFEVEGAAGPLRLLNIA